MLVSGRVYIEIIYTLTLWSNTENVPFVWGYAIENRFDGISD